MLGHQCSAPPWWVSQGAKTLQECGTRGVRGATCLGSWRPDEAKEDLGRFEGIPLNYSIWWVVTWVVTHLEPENVSSRPIWDRPPGFWRFHSFNHWGRSCEPRPDRRNEARHPSKPLQTGPSDSKGRSVRRFGCCLSAGLGSFVLVVRIEYG